MRRKRDEPHVIYGDGSYGREVKDPFPEGVLAFIQPHEYANTERLERARAIFPEADLNDFELVETGIDKWLFIDRATGEKYRRVEYDPLLQMNPRATDITTFCVDAGGRFHYLRPIGPPVPEESAVLVTSVVGRELT